MIDFIVFKFFSILISLCLLKYSFLLKRLNGDIHTPGSLYSFYWFLFTFFPIIFLFFVPINPLPLLYILISAIAFSISSFHYDWKLIKKINDKSHFFDLKSLDNKFLKIVFYLSFICSILFPLLMLIQNGFNLELFLLDWASTSSRFATTRANDGYEYGLIGQLSTFFPLFVAALGSAISFTTNIKSKKITYFILSLLPALIFMLFHSSKIIFLYAIVFYISVLISLKLYLGFNEILSKVAIKSIFIFLIFFSPILLLTFTLREGYNDLSNDIFLPTILSYLFGSIYAFSDFFMSILGLGSQSIYLVENNYSLGYYSFKSLFDFLGGTKVFPPGYYYDFYNYNNYIQTNIFTFFRQLIQDFGILGSLLFIYIMGVILNFNYYLILKIRKPYLSLTIFIIFLVFLGMSQMFNIFTTRLSLMVALSLYLIFKLNCIKLSKKSNR